MTPINHVFNSKLIGYTQPSKEMLTDFTTVKELVAFCARVSNPGNQCNTKTSDGLINYLVKHKHWSPFEMANVLLEVNTTRDIGRQLLRHRSFAFQEFSQRYADPTKDMVFITREARLQDQANRQASIETDDQELQAQWDLYQEHVIEESLEAYKWAIDNGIAKEQARAVLPEGLTMSRLYVNGTIRSWIHYLEVRLDQGTQKEHRVLALSIASMIAQVFSLPELLSVDKNS